MLGLFQEPAIAIFLATLYPTISMIADNTGLFSKRQMACSILAMSCMGAVFVALFSVFDVFALTPFLAKFLATPSTGSNLIASLLSLGIFFFLSERLFSELIRDRKTRLYTKLAIVALVCTATAFISMMVLNGILILCTALSIWDVRNSLQKTKTEFSTSQTEETDESSKPVTFKHKPNVYVLFLESFHSTDALKTVYGIDNTEFCSGLENQGFKVYDDAFSNLYMTELSFSTLLWPEKIYNPLHFREASPVPQSPIFQAFRQNGYRTNLYSSDYLKSRFSDLFDYSDSESPNAVSVLNRLFAPVFAQSAVLREWFSTGDVFENVMDFDSLLGDMQTKMQEHKDTPQLHWFHFGANHSPQVPWNELAEWEETYATRYQNAEEQLQTTVDMIKEQDSDPLIIAVGDHGAFRYRYVYDGVGDPNEVMRSRGVEPATIAKDVCGVFLGIHWPVSHHTNGQVLSHVRLFKYVLAALSEDTSHLDDMMPNESLFLSHKIRKPLVLVRDGVPLENWEPVSEEKQLSQFLDNVKRDPKNVHVHLELFSKYVKMDQKDKAFEYITALTKQFPESEEVHTTYARILVERKEYETARKHALNAVEINPSSGLAYYWLGIIAENQGQLDKSDSFIAKAYECGGSLIIKKDLHLRYSYLLMKEEKYDEASRVIDLLDYQDRVQFTDIIDWQMQYMSFQAGRNEHLMTWLDDSITDSTARYRKLIIHERKLILCLLTEQWKQAEQEARTVLEYNDQHLGAHAALGRSLELQGRIPEGLQACADGLAKTQNSVLLEQLGYMAIRNNIRHPDLVRIKAMAREECRKRESYWAKLTSFDAQWYAKRYGHMLGGLKPLEHYIQNALPLMLNPNGAFDTAYYYSNHTDVFKSGVDASLHYSQYGQYEIFRPRVTCFIDHSVEPNVNWRSAAA